MRRSSASDHGISDCSGLILFCARLAATASPQDSVFGCRCGCGCVGEGGSRGGGALTYSPLGTSQTTRSAPFITRFISVTNF